MHQDRAGRTRDARRIGRGIGAGLLLLLAVAPAGAQEDKGPPTLTVRGTGSVTAAPDVAWMSVSVLTRGPSLEAAVRDHTGRVATAKAVLARLAAAGVGVDEGSFSLGEEPAPPGPDGRRAAQPPTFRAETRFDLVLRRLDTIDAVAGDIVGAGVFEFGSTRFGVMDRTSATDRARRAAMADARHQADIYAEAGELRLDGIQRIADADATGSDALYDMPVRAARAAKVGITPPKTLDFQASVTVTWRVAPR